eukprot:TRINITY_DN594_c3_g1_i2.p1 TRINITY_DN594_c3_g1~~TRINITY_DN594_c3_g1_i2.p1  ORF type:complete len:127 (-),score=44.30 TRINITY_DN594_c3_g1_i2:57-437(-)
MYNDYATVEKFITGREYDIRVQAIGDKLRAYHRKSDNWKGNVGTSFIEEVEVTDKYKFWATECSKLFGGLTIFTVDAIHTKDDEGIERDYIIEINDSASGFLNDNLEEDMNDVSNLVFEKIKNNIK